MLEFENIAYMDMQKTGSSTIKYVLSRILDEKEIYRRAHRGIREEYDRSKLSFISVREPLSLYISLFSFGAGSRLGSLYETLCRNGYEDFFEPNLEAFERWLDFMLDPQNAHVLKSGYGSTAHDAIGFLSYRLLHICVPKSQHRMEKKNFQKPARIREVFGKHLYHDHVRLENLGSDLFAFLNRHSSCLQLRQPLTTADDLMAHLPVRNASPKIAGLKPETVSASLRQRVREREWLFYEAFGYDVDPKGRPPNCIAETSQPAEPKRREMRRQQRASRRG